MQLNTPYARNNIEKSNRQIPININNVTFQKHGGACAIMCVLKQKHSHIFIYIIKWAKPLVDSLMTEGQVIHEFVHNNIRIESMKPGLSYRDEGYLIVADYNNLLLLLIEYQRSFFDSNNKLSRSLKTKLLKQISIRSNEKSIRDLGLILIDKYGSIVNPDVFICKIDLDLPFRETLFPIIKSKLLTFLTKYSGKRYYL